MWRGPELLVTEEGEVDEVLEVVTGVEEGEVLMCVSGSGGTEGGGGGDSS